MDYYPLGIVQLTQAVVVLLLGLLLVGFLARRGYSRSGWLRRMGVLVVVFVVLCVAEVLLNDGAGGPSDFHGVGITLHRWVMLVASGVIAGTVIAALRARRRGLARAGSDSQNASPRLPIDNLRDGGPAGGQ